MVTESSEQKLIVGLESAGQRLDIFISEQLGTSRSQVQKLIDKKLIYVNDKLPKKAGDRVKVDDTVLLPASNLKASSTAAAPNHSRKRKGGKASSPFQGEVGRGLPSLTPKIISATPDYLVVEKPTGLLTHPTMAHEPSTLSTFLTQKYPELTTVGEDTARPGIVHRLDKEASGLLVVARTQSMFMHLKDQFKKRTIEKEYCVLVHGRVARDEVTIDFPIARSENAERMAAIPATRRGKVIPEGKFALTEFLVEKRFKNFTLLRVKIHTGRMHQIRVHLLAYNHPVVGDPLYFQKKRPTKWDEKLGRLFLHSTKLSFVDLEQQKQNFESPLPKELEQFLTLLK